MKSSFIQEKHFQTRWIWEKQNWNNNYNPFPTSHFHQSAIPRIPLRSQPQGGPHTQHTDPHESASTVYQALFEMFGDTNMTRSPCPQSPQGGRPHRSLLQHNLQRTPGGRGASRTRFHKRHLRRACLATGERLCQSCSNKARGKGSFFIFLIFT